MTQYDASMPNVHIAFKPQVLKNTFGEYISNLGLKERTVPAFTNVISLSFCFLGGIFVPLEMLGGMAKTLGRFVPTFWYSRAVEKIQNGGGFGDIANFLLIQLLFGVMVMTVGLAIGKAKMQKSE